MPVKSKYELPMGAATREAFGKALVEVGRMNPNVVALDADLSKSLVNGIVDVAADDSFANRQRRRAPQRHVLTDLGDGLGNSFGQSDVADFRRLDLLHVRADRQRNIGDHLHQALKQIVACDEIGFTIDFDHRTQFAVMHVSSDQPLLGFPTGLLGARGETSLAQNYDRSLDIALGFLKGALAFHESDASLLPELFHKFRGYAHIKLPVIVSWPNGSRRLVCPVTGEPRAADGHRDLRVRAEINSRFGRASRASLGIVERRDTRRIGVP